MPDSRSEADGGATPPSLIGQLIDGRYEIQRQLGSGGMGEIYLARQLQLELLRAVKTIRTELQDDHEIEARFRREAMALSRLDHPSIVKIIDFGRLADGTCYLVMEYVEGVDLEQIVTVQPLLVEQAIELLGQLADALLYAHGAGIVHRDLKPQNILLHGSQAKIVDFGLVKLLSDEALSKLTKDNQFLGSPLFMAPEQCDNREVGPAADIYALAGLGYYLISGQPVFPIREPMPLIFAHLSKEPESLAARCPSLQIPPELDELLLGCLAKDANERPTAAELRGSLNRLAHAGPASAQTLAQRATLMIEAGEHEAEPGTDRVGKTALRIWRDSVLSFDEELDTSGDPALARALFHQIGSLTLDIATRLEAHLSKPFGEVARIRRLEESLQNLELDIALMDSQLEELFGRDAVREQELARQRERVAAKADELRKVQFAAYRALFQQTLEHRQRVSDPALVPLYDELDSMTDELVGLFVC